MKRSTELINLPILSIEDGREIGKIKSLIVDPRKSEVAALAVSDERWYREVKVVSYALVCGIGEYAATVESESSVVNLSSIPEIERLLLEDIKVIDAKVITRSGKLIGKVLEYLIDEKTGKIISYEIVLFPEEENVSIPSNSVLTIGQNVLIVVDDIQNYFGKEPEPSLLEKKEIPPKKEIVTTPKIVEIKPEEKEEAPEKIEPTSSYEEEAKPETVLEKKQPVDLAKLFEERKKKFVLGKIATRTIEAPDGEIIVSENEVITEDIIAKAESYGKFTELSLNVRAGG